MQTVSKRIGNFLNETHAFFFIYSVTNHASFKSFCSRLSSKILHISNVDRLSIEVKKLPERKLISIYKKAHHDSDKLCII